MIGKLWVGFGDDGMFSPWISPNGMRPPGFGEYYDAELLVREVKTLRAENRRLKAAHLRRMEQVSRRCSREWYDEMCQEKSFGNEAYVEAARRRVRRYWLLGDAAFEARKKLAGDEDCQE